MKELGLFVVSLCVSLATSQVIFLLPQHFLQSPKPDQPNPFANLNLQELINSQTGSQVQSTSPTTAESTAASSVTEATSISSVAPSEPSTAASVSTTVNSIQENVIAADLNVARTAQASVSAPADSRTPIKPIPAAINIQPQLSPIPEALPQVAVQLPEVPLVNPTASLIVNSPLRHLTLGSIAVPKHLLPLTPRELVEKAAAERLTAQQTETTVPTTSAPSTTQTIPLTTSIIPEPTTSAQVSSQAPTTPAPASTLSPEITTLSRKKVDTPLSNQIPGTDSAKGKTLFPSSPQFLIPGQAVQSLVSPVASPAQPAFDPLLLVDPRFRQFIYPNDSPEVVAAKIALFRLHAAALPPIQAAGQQTAVV